MPGAWLTAWVQSSTVRSRGSANWIVFAADVWSVRCHSRRERTEARQARYVDFDPPGSVIVDVTIDQGGCFETSRPTTDADLTYEADGAIHYCVANMPELCRSPRARL